jgi:hypothetical protein
MTDTASPRYLVRRGVRDWMVWDRQTRSAAKCRGTQTIGLTEERAREIRDELTEAVRRLVELGLKAKK